MSIIHVGLMLVVSYVVLSEINKPSEDSSLILDMDFLKGEKNDR